MVDQAYRKKKLGINYCVFFFNFEHWKLTDFSLEDLVSQSEAKCLPAFSNYLSAVNSSMRYFGFFAHQQKKAKFLLAFIDEQFIIQVGMRNF